MSFLSTSCAREARSGTRARVGNSDASYFVQASVKVSPGNIMADMKDFPFISDGEHELKLGSSFNHTGAASSAFHTIRCEYAIF